jgi:hypothetical protein
MLGDRSGFYLVANPIAILRRARLSYGRLSLPIPKLRGSVLVPLGRISDEQKILLQTFGLHSASTIPVAKFGQIDGSRRQSGRFSCPSRPPLGPVLADR